MTPAHGRLGRLSCRSLRPGGWLENQDAWPHITCDDGTIPTDYAPHRFYELLAATFRERHQWDISYLCRFPAALERAGFVNVQRRVLHVPIGEWPRDRKLRVLGCLMREIMAGFMLAVATKPFAEADMDAAEVEDLLNAAAAAMHNRRIHAYMPIQWIWAQKPPSA